MAEEVKRKYGDNRDYLVPLEKGTERTKRIASMGGKASAAKKKEKADLQYVAELLGKYLLKPVKGGGKVVEIDDVDSLEELDSDAINQRLIDKTLSEFGKRLKSGDKRAITQMVEILAVCNDAENKEADNGFIEALGGSVKEDWDDEL